YQSLPHLGWAYLDADEGIEPRAPSPRSEAPAARQTLSSSHDWQAEDGGAVGQSFVATASPLVRIDARIRNHGSEAPGIVSLWRWRGSHRATVRAAPLFRDALELRGADAFSVRSALPFLDVEVGARYLVEFEREGSPFSLGGSRPDEDSYADGSLHVAGREVKGADLWFVSHTLSDGGSTWTTRKRVVPIPKPEWREPRPRQFVFAGERVPDKVILRSGFDPDDLHAVVNLLGGYMHGQQEIGAVTSLVDGGSVLLAGTPIPYFTQQNAAEDESAPLLRRHWGGSAADPGSHATITRFSDSRNATVVWIEWKDPQGWNVRQERRLYFVKNRFLLVRDRFAFPTPMGVSVGPVWHAGDVHPERGDHWFDVYYREPLSNVWKVRNPERYALLYFVPRPGHVSAFHLEDAYLPGAGCPRDAPSDRVALECRSGPPYVVHQRWKGDVQANEARWFDTLLLPHGPERGPAQIAEGIRVLHADREGVALEVAIGDETWTVLDSPRGTPIEAPGLSADARYAVLRTAPGRPPYLLVHEATRLDRRNLSHRWPVRTSVELGGSAAASRVDPGSSWRPENR
ncbi:MAG: hypothetical protein ACYTAF_12190, partial [Planctomycetota bacterium]